MFFLLNSTFNNVDKFIKVKNGPKKADPISVLGINC